MLTLCSMETCQQVCMKGLPPSIQYSISRGQTQLRSQCCTGKVGSRKNDQIVNLPPTHQRKNSVFMNNNDKVSRVNVLCSKCEISPFKTLPQQVHKSMHQSHTLFGTSFGTCERDHVRVSDVQTKGSNEEAVKSYQSPLPYPSK